MPTNIRIEVTQGGRFVSDADRERAMNAAVSALGGEDPGEASAAYARQIERFLGDTSCLTGLAAVWDRVQSAADVALTEGWHDPNGAFCEVVAL